jgi:hypothetical protein
MWAPKLWRLCLLNGVQPAEKKGENGFPRVIVNYAQESACFVLSFVIGAIESWSKTTQS